MFLKFSKLPLLWNKWPQVNTISSSVKMAKEHPADISLPPLAALQKGLWAPWPGHLWGQTGRCSQRSNWQALLVHLHCNTERWRGRIWWTGGLGQNAHTCRSSLCPCSYLAKQKKTFIGPHDETFKTLGLFLAWRRNWIFRWFRGCEIIFRRT